MEPLADPTDLQRFGFPDVDPAMLERASARVRAYTGGQQIVAGTSTVEAIPGDRVIRLFQHPVTAVVSVVAVGPNGSEVTIPNYYTYREQYTTFDVPGLIPPPWYIADGRSVTFPSRLLSPVRITYDHGHETVPDALVEVVCSVATRLASTPAAAAGIAQEDIGSGSYSVQYTETRAAGGLLAGERSVIDRFFPKELVGTVAM